MMIDLDGFKSVNDSYGHPVGDDVLHQLCQRVRGVLRSDELLARYGGEEFTVLLAHSAEADALTSAERVRQTVAQKPFVRRRSIEIPLTVSIGLATSRGDGRGRTAGRRRPQSLSGQAARPQPRRGVKPLGGRCAAANLAAFGFSDGRRPAFSFRAGISRLRVRTPCPAGRNLARWRATCSHDSIRSPHPS